MWAIAARTKGSVKEINDDDKKTCGIKKSITIDQKHKEAEKSMHMLFSRLGCLSSPYKSTIQAHP